MPASRPIEERLLDKLEPVPMGWEGFAACWTYTGGQRGGSRDWDTGGHYGSVWYEGKTRSPHRLVIELYVGPLEANEHGAHTCRNRRCINPAHVRPVEPRINVLEAWEVRRAFEEAAEEKARWL
jgi:hypothetical protein